jgi:hypothetical protein
MTREENRGRRITLALACLVGIPPVLNVLILLSVGRPIPSGTWLFRVVIPLALAWLLYRGYRWARGYIAFSFGLGAVLGAARLAAVSAPVMVKLLVVPFLALPFWAAVILWKSPSVGAYFDRENAFPTLKINDGV